MQMTLQGAKKGSSSSRTPVEAEDSLFSISKAKILDLICEGEIVGLVDGMKSIYLDDTPLQAADGSMNFKDVVVDTRVGTIDQDYIPGFPAVESETAIGVELTSDRPVVRAVSNANLSAVRITLSLPGLQKADTSNGDVNGYSISYAIDLSTDGGAYTTVLTNAFTGKTTSTYQRSHRIDLPAGSSWQIRIRRLTANANSTTISDTTNVTSLTEIIDAKLRYPMSALVGLEVNAEQFSAVPKRSYRMKLQIIRVPANYDPDNRTYSGTWDGTFKRAWSNNPAWVFYDMVLSDVYGLGNLVDASQLDKWNLYQIGQYCDVLVSDGKGGQEPRFTCNTYIQSRGQAYQVLKDLASVFRGISFYSGDQIYARADMPRDPVYTYSAANILQSSRFSYSGSARSARYTAALVSWVNLDNNAELEPTYVEYAAGIDRYGYRQTEVNAFGCTSEAQAQRLGMHLLLSDCLETETVQFQVGLDSVNCVPGDVIQVADAKRAGRRMGGRISSAANNRTLVLDKVEVLAAGDTLWCKLPSGALEGRTVQLVQGRSVTVAAPYSAVPAAQAMWSAETAELALQLFRVINISEDDDAITYTITALKYVPGKFAAIDSGAAIDTKPITVVPSASQQPPTGITIAGRAVIMQGIATNVMTISWTAPAGAVAYDVQWRKDNGNWVNAGRVGTTSVEVSGIYTGTYVARVRALNAADVASVYGTSVATEVTGKTGAPPVLASLSTESEIFGIRLDWAFPEGASDTSYTEIYYGTGSALENAALLGQFAYPTNTHRLQGLAAGVQFFFWGRLIDKSGNVGAWYPDGPGVAGRSSTDAGAILDYLTGKITESQLGKDLLAKVESIGDLLPLVWDSASTYSKGQTVVYGGHIYSWESDTAGNETPPGTSWQDVGDAIAAMGAVVGQVSKNTQDIANLDGKVTAQGTKVDGIFAQLDVKAAGDSDWGAGDTSVYAGTITVQSVIASGDLAQAQRTDTVEASLGTTNAAVQATSKAVATLDGKASSSYVVKTAVTSGGQYYAAGIALGIDASGGTVQSSFLVYADLFGVLNGTGSDATVTSPFTISGGQVFIRSAVIQDGSITNAKIGDTIQSTATGASGLPRWKLDKAGTFTMTGVNANGGYMQLTDSALRFWNSDGSIALVELGELL